MTKLPLVSVVVPAHNGEKSLPRLLHAFGGQSAPADLFEVLVVDDCSEDRSAELVEASAHAQLIRAPKRGGSYVARNLGVAEARGSVVAFTDTDCMPAEDWIETGAAAIQADGADVVAGHVEVPLGQNPSTAALLDFTRYLDQERHVKAHGFGATANLWVRREVLERVGPFNERLTTGGDLEFGNRVSRSGFDLRYAPEVVVEHQPRSCFRQLARKGVPDRDRHSTAPQARERAHASRAAHLRAPRRLRAAPPARSRRVRSPRAQRVHANAQPHAGDAHAPVFLPPASDPRREHRGLDLRSGRSAPKRAQGALT